MLSEAVPPSAVEKIFLVHIFFELPIQKVGRNMTGSQRIYLLPTLHLLKYATTCPCDF